MSKVNQSRRQFLRSASLASMAGISVSPFFLELNSVAALAHGISMPPWPRSSPSMSRSVWSFALRALTS